jgi:hypothetical protein
VVLPSVAAKLRPRHRDVLKHSLLTIVISTEVDGYPLKWGVVGSRNRLIKCVEVGGLAIGEGYALGEEPAAGQTSEFVRMYRTAAAVLGHRVITNGAASVAPFNALRVQG